MSNQVFGTYNAGSNFTKPLCVRVCRGTKALIILTIISVAHHLFTEWWSIKRK